MTPYNVNTTEYLESSEFNSIVNFIQEIKTARATDLNTRYPTYQIKPRCAHDKINTYHLTEHNVPFFDIICETLLYKDKCAYLELNEFVFQANCFARTIFHRLWWADAVSGNRDQFLDFIWQDWKDTQFQNRFDNLESMARRQFDSSSNLLDYFKSFVYNYDYKFISVDEARDLFDELVTGGVFLGKIGDLYQVVDNIEFDSIDTDSKSKLEHMTKLELLHLQSKYKIKTLPVLKNINSKFNFIPKNDLAGKFKGEVVEVKLGKSVCFIPQFLFFYNQVDNQ
jgi:hypothetical protein